MQMMTGKKVCPPQELTSCRVRLGRCIQARLRRFLLALMPTVHATAAGQRLGRREEHMGPGGSAGLLQRQ